MLPYITGAVKESPRNSFAYISDDGDVLAHPDRRLEDGADGAAGQARCSAGSSPSSSCASRRSSTCGATRSSGPTRTPTPTGTGCISHAYLIYLMQGFVAGQIETFKKFPPRQKPASFNLDAVLAIPARTRPAAPTTEPHSQSVKAGARQPDSGPVAAPFPRGPAHVRRARRTGPDPVGALAAGVPPPGQAERVHLQHRLHLLLLPFEGRAVPRRQAADVRGHPRGLHPPAARGAPDPPGDGGLAGGGADAHGAPLLRPRRRAGREVPPAGAGRAADLPDQRDPPRRRVVRLLQEARLPRRA